MENTNAIDEIKRMADILSASRTERKAFILMPTFKGFDVYEVSEKLAQHCINSESLRKSAEADSTGEGQSNMPVVKASALEKLKIAKKALNDIYNFDRDMELEYGDPGERAMRALEAIDRIDGF